MYEDGAENHENTCLMFSVADIYVSWNSQGQVEEGFERGWCQVDCLQVGQ